MLVYFINHIEHLINHKHFDSVLNEQIRQKGNFSGIILCYENMGIFLENPLISCPINMSPEIFLQHLCHFSVGILNHMVASCVLRPEGSVIMTKSLQLGETQRSLYLENIQNLSTHACKQVVTY